MTDTNYETWNRLLPTHGSPDPESPIGAGFWRLPSSKGHARPVATWIEDNVWQVVRHGLDEFDSVEKRGAYLRFVELGWPCLEAWSAEDYDRACDTAMWPDNVPAQPKGLNPSQVVPEIANPPLGHNETERGDRHDELVESLDALVAEAAKLAAKGGATTQEGADIAANLKTRIRDVRQLIIAEHRAQKAPVLERGKSIDARWFRHRDRAEALEKRLHEVVVRPWLLEQQRLADEARKAAEEARRSGNADIPDIPGRVTAGAKGRKDYLRTKWIGTIENYPEFYDAVRDHQPVQEFMKDYAQSKAANWREIGAIVPGLTITETKV